MAHQRRAADEPRANAVRLDRHQRAKGSASASASGTSTKATGASPAASAGSPVSGSGKASAAGVAPAVRGRRWQFAAGSPRPFGQVGAAAARSARRCVAPPRPGDRAGRVVRHRRRVRRRAPAREFPRPARRAHSTSRPADAAPAAQPCRQPQRRARAGRWCAPSRRSRSASRGMPPTCTVFAVRRPAAVVREIIVALLNATSGSFASSSFEQRAPGLRQQRPRPASAISRVRRFGVPGLRPLPAGFAPPGGRPGPRRMAAPRTVSPGSNGAVCCPGVAPASVSRALVGVKCAFSLACAGLRDCQAARSKRLPTAWPDPLCRPRG